MTHYNITSSWCGALKDITQWPAHAPLGDSPSWLRIVNGVYQASGGGNGKACSVKQLFYDIPQLAPLYPFSAEREWAAWYMSRFANRYTWVAFVICAVYLALTYFGQKYMSSREKPYNFHALMNVWNLLLAVFSIIGYLRTMPHLLNTLLTVANDHGWWTGYYNSICAPAESAYGHGAAGLWVMLFIFSKIPELFDTFFLVVHKNRVIFLHWYHHATVMLFCWHSYSTRSSAGIYFASINYGVHALMYFYFFLMGTSWKGAVKRYAHIVTTFQISQMFVGMIICGSVAYYKYGAREQCDMTDSNLFWGGLMYASYAALFIDFAVGKFSGFSLAKLLGAELGVKNPKALPDASEQAPIHVPAAAQVANETPRASKSPARRAKSAESPAPRAKSPDAKASESKKGDPASLRRRKTSAGASSRDRSPGKAARTRAGKAKARL